MKVLDLMKSEPMTSLSLHQGDSHLWNGDSPDVVPPQCSPYVRQDSWAGAE